MFYLSLTDDKVLPAKILQFCFFQHSPAIFLVFPEEPWVPLSLREIGEEKVVVVTEGFVCS